MELGSLKVLLGTGQPAKLFHCAPITPQTLYPRLVSHVLTSALYWLTLFFSSSSPLQIYGLTTLLVPDPVYNIIPESSNYVGCSS